MSDYAGVSLFDVQLMDIVDYLTIRRDAWIHKLNETEKGQEYLDNAWRLEQTAPNRNALREKFGKG